IQTNESGSYVLTQANLEQVFDGSNFTELLDLISGSSSNYLPSNFSSSLNLNNQVIENVGAPVAVSDAANKGYVDTNIGGSAANSSLSSLGAPEAGQVLVWSGTEWTASTPAGDSTKLDKSGG